MKMHREDGPPCSHMEGLLNQAADGSIHGIRLWYATSHARRCSPCGNYLRRLGDTIAHLRSARGTGPSEERMRRMRAAVPVESEG